MARKGQRQVSQTPFPEGPLMSPLAMFAALVAGHALCDYPLQGDFLAKGKNRTASIAITTQTHPALWPPTFSPYSMSALANARLFRLGKPQPRGRGWIAKP